MNPKTLNKKTSPPHHCNNRGFSFVGSLVIIAFALFVLLMIIGTIRSEQDKRTIAKMSPAERELHAQQKAARMAPFACMDFIKQGLHDPDSADFDKSTTYQTRRDGDYFIVTGGVRAKNAFNATRHALYECKMTNYGEKFFLATIKQLN